MELYPESEDEKEIVYFVLMAVCGVIAIIGVLSLLYAWGFMVCLPQWVDVCLWTAWIGLALQLWDFASDISLCHELWTHDKIYKSSMEGRLILTSAIGCTLFIIV